ncbi:Neur-chan-LBD domain-containing protein [Aphelenchoides besseyi]|nr:Neur-chan-LBD domain-containing protein [Aphelenchoides besseyi]
MQIRLFLLFYLTSLVLNVNAVFNQKHKSRLKPIRLEERRSRNELSADESEDDLYEFDDPNNLLLDYIKTRSRFYRRPVLHADDVTEVHVRASLYQVVDLDQRNNLATLSAYLDVWWMDPFMPWNRTEFSGISKTFVPARWVWKPEFYLFHSIQGRTPDYDNEAVAEVRSDGRLRMFIPITSRALCPINLRHFPFDENQCTFNIGSWSYQSKVVRLVVDDRNIFLGDFYDSQEWLLMDATLSNGTQSYLNNETFSIIILNLLLRRQSFYYVFNLVFPTTLVSLVAIIGFHAPINATGRRESKFRLGVMTLLSLSVMLLMLVDEMKFSLESIPGQRGSFSDVPLLGIYYMTLILIVSVATCTSVIFVYLEKFALRNPAFTSIPIWLRFLAAKQLFCCYAPKRLRIDKNDRVDVNRNIKAHSNHSSMDDTAFRTLIPTELNFTEYQQQTAQQIANDIVLEAPTAVPIENQKLDLLINLMRELLETRREMHLRHQLPVYWDRLIRRLENISISFYLCLIAIDVAMLVWFERWY